MSLFGIIVTNVVIDAIVATIAIVAIVAIVAVVAVVAVVAANAYALFAPVAVAMLPLLSPSLLSPPLSLPLPPP